MKKICQIGFLKFGIGHYIAHLYPELASDYDITVATYWRGSPGDRLVMDDDIVAGSVKKYKQIIDPHGYKETFNSCSELFSFFNEGKFDLLNVHISGYTRMTSYTYIPVIEHFGKKGMKSLFTVHDVLPFPEGGKISPYLSYLYNLSDAAVVGNKKEKENLLGLFDYKKKAYIAAHGIYGLFNRGIFTQSLARKKLGLAASGGRGEAGTVLFFGILRENKGLADLIKALESLSKQNMGLNFILAVSERGGVSIGKYRDLIGKCGLLGRTKIIVGDFPVSEVELFFKACDVVVLPYTEVSQSGILNLAFAFEKPSIISRLFAESSKVDGKMGFAARPDNPRDLAEKIKRFFQDRNALSEKFARNIRKYNRKHTFKETAKVYKKAINDLLLS